MLEDVFKGCTFNEALFNTVELHACVDILIINDYYILLFVFVYAKNIFFIQSIFPPHVEFLSPEQTRTTAPTKSLAFLTHAETGTGRCHC